MWHAARKEGNNKATLARIQLASQNTNTQSKGQHSDEKATPARNLKQEESNVNATTSQQHYQQQTAATTTVTAAKEGNNKAMAARIIYTIGKQDATSRQVSKCQHRQGE